MSLIEQLTPTPDSIMALVHCLTESQPHKLARPILNAVRRVKKAQEEMEDAQRELNSECGRIRNKIMELWQEEEIREAASRASRTIKDWQEITQQATY